ncbi:MAG: H4MPT-linked C1 transfer pathway protein [Gemmatimonadales bacterium]|nr:H4MPT-linked C1 transfer pathway protein [Gemmatimonadales bacterium]
MAEGTSGASRVTSQPRPTVIGWDIGGVNTKAARIDSHGDGPPAVRTASVAYEIQRDPGALAATLAALAADLGGSQGCAHAVTMTAELSQVFRTKREGVGFVLDALADAFPGDALHVYTVDGRFVPPAAARVQPLAAGASNWAATAACVARDMPSGILIDIGTTSTDIIPIQASRVVARGRTDPARLLTGELVYTGAVRTPAEALVREVPLWGGAAAVSSEGFATIGDAHVWLGRLDPADFTVPTADGRPATREFAGERLARVVCGDREMLDEQAIDGIARALAEAQIELVAAAVCRVGAGFAGTANAMVAGLGDFIAAEAARRAGLTLLPLAARLRTAARTAPAAAVAWLLADELANR